MKLKIQKICFFFLLGLTSCQTSTNINLGEMVIPSALERFFDSCHGDGLISLVVNDSQGILFQGEAEWLYDKNNQFQLEMQNLFGQQLLFFSFNDKETQLLSKVIQKLPKLEIEIDNEKSSEKYGFFELEENTVPIKNKEFSCLLKGKLPREWKRILLSKEKNENHAFFFSDGRRRIMISFLGFDKRFENATRQKVCVTNEWGVWLGLLRRELNWCFHYSKQELEYSTLSWDQYFIKWRILSN